MITQPRRATSRLISAVIIAAVVILAGLITSTYWRGFAGVGPNGVEQTTSTVVNTAPIPSPDSYSLLVQEPQLVITPNNRTFAIPFAVETRNYSLSMTYDQPDSYAWLYSNNTQWVFSGRLCGLITSTLTANGTATTMTVTKSFTGKITTTSITAASQVPCGDFPGEWWSVNGTKISDHIAISPSEVQVTIQPSVFPAHYSGNATATLDVQMPPGNYAVFLAVQVQEPDNSNFGSKLLYLLYYMPVVVE